MSEAMKDVIDVSDEASHRLETPSPPSTRSDSTAPTHSETRSPISVFSVGASDSSPRPPSERSTSVPARNSFTRDSVSRSPLPYSQSAYHSPPAPRPSPKDGPSERARTGGHSRSASVPSSGFPFLPQAQSSERAGRVPEHLSPRTSSRWHAIARARFSAESEFFKPFIDVKSDRHAAVSPGPADSRKGIVRLSLSKSVDFSQQNNYSGAPGPPSGAGSPRQPPTTPENLFAGSQRGSGGRDGQPETRIIYVNNPERTNEKFRMAGNRVRTSKYTLVSFLPKNLFEQFHRYAYIYFLVIVILNQIPELAVFGRTASIFPLAFVLVITAVKDAYEDYGRHHSDLVENNRASLVLQDGHYKPKKWKHMRVGEVVKIFANETVPCDLVLLGTSDSSGVAYVETLNLDGESNLKSRYATQETAAKHPELGPVTGTLICEMPNRNIYEFTAYMDLGGIHLPLGPQNIVLRGCEIKNTSWVVGVVVYAGQETKAMLNSSGAQSKRSRLEHEMNRETLWLGLFLFVICLVGGIGMAQWVARHSDDLRELPYYRKKYADSDTNYRYYGVVGEGIIGFLSCVIVFQIMIPISLYISMELVRLGQAYFMANDAELYHESSNTRFQCRALNINEDLGQIKYVFSDKTGTLTENKMEFFAASINGVDYSDAKVAVDTSSGNVEGPPEVVNAVQDVLAKQAWKPKVGVKVDPTLVRALQHPFDTEERRAVHDYLLVLAACNTVVPTRVSISATTGQVEMQAAGTEEEVRGLMEYQGESPDEQALVAAAAGYGYTLLERTSTHIAIDVLGELQRFEVLGVHEFDSIRKRMSVIIRCPDGTTKLLMKGADSAVLDILEVLEGQEPAVQKRKAALSLSTLSHLDRYAREGLRTLVVASRDLDAIELQTWDAQYRQASSAVADRAGMLRAAAELVEKSLTLLGATGIEDKLQQGVPETIAQLREADMHVWVLTGDKQETAISIAFSCLLITRDMQQVIINETTVNGCKDALASARSSYGISEGKKKKKKKPRFQWRKEKTVDMVSNGESPSNGAEPNSGDESPGHGHRNSEQPLALIIDGNSLVHCLSEELEQELFDVAVACKVVVCCRVAPLQKAGIVSLIKRKAKEMTLAIGDGANDVSMIQMADVGIGISGQEGRQAVMASDFAMGQFRYLRRVLLVHGHWNYSRLGYMVLYNFYRNAVFVLMLFWFILYTLFSPQSALTDWNLIFYSLIYTSVPTIIVGILDKDLSHKTLLRYPTLYSAGQKSLSYNERLFWAFMIDTVWQSLVLFYVPFFTYRDTPVDIYGLGSLWTVGVVLLVNMHLAMDIQGWTWIHHVGIWVSILATWICIMVMDSISSIEDFLPHYWVFYHMVGEWTYWFDLLLILALGLLPRFGVKVFWQRFFPSDIQVAREVEIKGNGSVGREQGGVELNEVPHSPEPT